MGSKIFSKFNIGNLEIKNRIVFPAMHLSYCKNGFINDKLIEFYKRRSRGGVGLIIVGGCAIDDVGMSKNMIGIFNEDFEPGLLKLSQAIHKNGSRVMAQLFHSGRYAKSAITGKQVISASSVYSNYSKETPIEMTLNQIEETIEFFGRAALRANKCGFDGVEIIASAGFLISQFLSPITNLRLDKYGGSIENRFRFAGEIIDKIREYVGSDYPVVFRIAGNEFMNGGNTLPEAICFAKYLETKKVDAISVTGGWHETNIPQLSQHVPPGGFAYLADSVKRNVKIPVFAANRINDFTVAERILALNMADAVCMGRQLICDEDTPNKWVERKFSEVRKCIACGQGCSDHIFSGIALNCAINIEVGREYKFKYKSKKTNNIDKKVLIIGAGPAGLISAIKFAESGYNVTLTEKTGFLGGKLKYISNLENKNDYYDFLQYLIHKVDSLKVNIMTNCTFNTDEIIKQQPVYVVIATGREKTDLEVHNYGYAGEIATFYQVLSKECVPGQNVVIIANDSIECELAINIAKNSRLSFKEAEFLIRYKAEELDSINEMYNRQNRKITILTKDTKATSNFGISSKWIISQELKYYNIEVICNVNSVVAHDNSVSIQYDGKKEIKIPADILLTDFVESKSMLFDRLKEERLNVYKVGDAKVPGSRAYIVSATEQLVSKIVN